MTETIRPRRSRVIAATGAVALGFAGLFTGSAAFAAPADYGNIDANESGSIIINKHEHQGAGAVTGSPDGETSPTSPGIEGVEFTIYKIDGIDVTNAQHWDQLGGLSANSNCTIDGHTLTQVQKVTTGANGKVTAGNLDLGAYLVCETDAPSTVVDRALPFIVTIPLPFENGWLYDVNVFPKNALQGGITKKNLPQEQLKVGSPVKFEVTADVPTLGQGTHWEYFRIVDPMDANLEDLRAANVTLGGAALSEGTDYKVVTVGQQLIVQFTVAGMKKLEAAAPSQVRVEFSGKIKQVPADGVISNYAFTDTKTYVDPDPGNPTDPEEPEEPETPLDPPTDPEDPITPEVYSNWGDIKGLKYADGDNGEKQSLAGATFDVYVAANPYADTCTAEPTGNAVDTATSNADGLIHFEGLFVSQGVEDENGNKVDEHDFRCYVIVETAAPAGYVLDATPRAVKVNIGETSIVDAGYDAEIKNTQQGVPELPLTGGMGQLLMFGGGLALIALAVALLAVRRRAQTQA